MKWIVRLIAVIAVFAVVFVGLILLLPRERLARLATDQLSQATGRTVAITGDVSLSVWPMLGVKADGLQIGNAAWATHPFLLEASQVTIGVDTLSLLGETVKINNIEVTQPVIWLEKRADGRANWVFEDATEIAQDSGTSQSAAQQAEPASAPARDSKGVVIEKLTISDATLIYNQEGEPQRRYEGTNVELDWPDPKGAASLNAVFSPAGTPVSVAAEVDGFASFLAGQVQPLSLRVEAAQGLMSLQGRAGLTGDVAGRLRLDADNTAKFTQNLGLPPVELPSGMGSELAIDADITFTTDKQLSLRNLVLELQRNRVTGAADVNFADVPQINAQLDAGDLVLSNDSSSGGSGGNSGKPSGKKTGWSTEAIDASALSTFNGDIALRARSIDLGRFKLGETRALLRNSNARLVFELQQVQAYSGNVTGEFVANNRSGLSVGGKLQAQGIEMKTLLDDAIDFSRLTGRGTLRLNFLGVGETLDQIMRSLSGDGALGVGRGTIEGIDLDRLLTGGAQSGTTIFNDLNASWTIAEGVLKNKDLLLELKNYQAGGRGDIDLGEQRIDYTITPVALRANSGEGLAVPVRFRGPWADISIRPGVDALINSRLKKESEGLADKVREKLSEEIGREVDEDQSIEDVILEEAQDKLLRKLFD